MHCNVLRVSSALQADVSEVGPLVQAEPSAAELAMLANWRSNLAALASYMASPADEALIVRLGDRLWEQQGQVRFFIAAPVSIICSPTCQPTVDTATTHPSWPSLSESSKRGCSMLDEHVELLQRCRSTQQARHMPRQFNLPK